VSMKKKSISKVKGTKGIKTSRPVKLKKQGPASKPAGKGKLKASVKYGSARSWMGRPTREESVLLQMLCSVCGRQAAKLSGRTVGCNVHGIRKLIPRKSMAKLAQGPERTAQAPAIPVENPTVEPRRWGGFLRSSYTRTV
jgi:hypothetical protein